MSSFVTSWIPTTAAAVTRSADSCQILPANMGFYTSPASWMAEYICLDPAPTDNRLLGYPVASAKTQIYINSASQASTYDGAGALAATNTAPTGTVAKASSTWTSNTGSVCLNGGSVASAGGFTGGFSDAATAGLGIMQYGVAADGLTGYIRRVRYWPRVLSNAELQSVTR